MSEKDYTRGMRFAYVGIISECSRMLGYGEDPFSKRASWIIEREETIHALRGVCAEFGDNDWDEDLHLQDVIEKHLARNIRDRAERRKR